MTDPVVTTSFQTVRVKYTHYGDWLPYASFAVSFGYRSKPTNDRATRVVRLWIDNVLVYDLFANIGSVFWTFYPGTQDQPFYRGQMVLFFKHLQLATDAIPAISAEIVDGVGLGAVVGTVYVGQNLAIGAQDYNAGRIDQAIVVGSNTLFRQILTASNGEGDSTYLDQVLSIDKVAFAPWSNNALCFAGDTLQLIDYSPLVLAKVAATLADPAIVAPDMVLAHTISQFYSTALTFFFMVSPEDAGAWSYQVVRQNGAKLSLDGTGSWDTEPVCIARGGHEGNPNPGLFGTAAALVFGEVYTAFDLSLRRVIVGNTGALTDDLIYTHGDAGEIKRVYYYDELGSGSGGDLVMLIETDAGTHAGYARRIKQDGTVVWTSDAFTLDAVSPKQFQSLSTGADLSAGRLAVVAGAGSYSVVNLSDGFVSAGTYSGISIDPTLPQFWVSSKETLYPADIDNQYLQLDVPSSDPISLVTLLADLASTAGYTDEQIIINGLDDVTVLGLIIGSNTALEDVLNNLQTLYQFTWAEIGDALYVQAIFADNVFISQLSVTDLAEVTDGEPAILSTVVGGADKVPYQLTVTFLDPALSYQQNGETVSRSKAPFATVPSEATLSFNVPIVESAAKMRSLLYRALYASWTAQNSHSLRLPTEYLALIPSDGFTFSALGLDHAVTAVDVVLNGDWSVSVSTVERLAAIRAPVLDTATVERPPARGPLRPIRGLLLDLPDIAISQEQDGFLNLGVALSGYAAGQWLSGQVQTADVGAPGGWSTRLTTTTEVPIGTVVAMAGDRSHLGPFETDNRTQITFAWRTIPTDCWSDATTDDLLAGKNLIAIGRDARYELMRFGNIVDNGDGTATISTLHRGLYGTEPVISMHQAGDYVVPYDALDFITLRDEDYASHATYVYRAFPNGGDPSTAAQSFIIPQAIAKRLRAPVHVRAAIDGTGRVDIWFKRRERFNAPLADFTADIPDVAGQSFSVDLYRPDKTGIAFRSAVVNLSADGYNHVWIEASEFTGAGYTSESLTVAVIAYQQDAALGRGWGGVGFDIPLEIYDPAVGPGGGIDVGTAAAIIGVLSALASDIDVRLPLPVTVTGALGKVASVVAVSIPNATVISATMKKVASLVAVQVPNRFTVGGAMGGVASSIAAGTGSGGGGDNLQFGSDNMLLGSDKIGFS